MNYYEILKVSKSASQQEIRDSYIKLIKQYHPDIYKGSKAFAEKTTKEINDAYDVLSVEEKRKEYDISLEASEPQYTPPDYSYTTYKPYYSKHTEQKQQKEKTKERTKKHEKHIYRIPKMYNMQKSKKMVTRKQNRSRRKKHCNRNTNRARTRKMDTKKRTRHKKMVQHKWAKI